MFPVIEASTLFVRNFYEGCYTGPLNQFQPNSSICTIGNRRYTKFIIFGNPGIGKSAFGLYLLFKAIHCNRNVVYITCKYHHAWIFFKDGIVTPISKTGNLEALPIVNSPDTVVICDSMKPPFVPAFTILITSPRFSHWVEFASAEGCYRLIFPVFSEAELVLMNDKCNKQVPDDIDKERYRAWGGIPRYVLSEITDDDQIQLDGSFTLSTVQQIPDILSSINPGTEKEFSHRLVQYVTSGEIVTDSEQKLETTDYKYYGLAGLRIASNKVVKNYR